MEEIEGGYPAPPATEPIPALHKVKSAEADRGRVKEVEPVSTGFTLCSRVS